MIADEQGDRYARPFVKTMDRCDHDPVGDDGPGRNEIGRQQHAVECTDPPVSEHIASRFSADSFSACGFSGEVTPLNSDGQFKPFIYLNGGPHGVRCPGFERPAAKSPSRPCRTARPRWIT